MHKGEESSGIRTAHLPSNAQILLPPRRKTHSESFLNDIRNDSANKTMECNSLHLSPRSSPLPTFRSIDVMITPPPAPQPRMLYLLKPRDTQEVHRRGRHDDTSPSKLTGPPFPILERRDDHRHLWHQQQQQRPKLCRPIPRYHS